MDAFNLAIELFDNNDVSYKLDSDDQVMVRGESEKEALECLDFLGIPYKEAEDKVQTASAE